MSKEKQEAPPPYSDDGQRFVGEGRGAPEAPINPKEPERDDDKKKSNYFKQR